MSFEQAEGMFTLPVIGFILCTDVMTFSVMAIRHAMLVVLRFMSNHVRGLVFPVLWNMAPATTSVPLPPSRSPSLYAC